MKLRNEAILTRNPDGTPAFSDDKIQGTLEGRNQYVYPNVDWFDYMFKDYSMNQSANLNVMGGTKKVDYFISASINNDNGMLKKIRITHSTTIYRIFATRSKVTWEHG